jgi:hypothetical protein
VSVDPGELRPSGAPEADEPFRKEKLVAHFKDGLVARGYSRDFRPDAEIFHLMTWDSEITSSRQIRLAQLKALFHVKTWGSPGRRPDRRKEFPPQPGPEIATTGSAPRTIVQFYDGEEIWGYSQGYRSEAPGFFMVPADPQDNNQKIFVINSSLIDIQFLDN